MAITVTVIVAYDIPVDKRRARIAALLQSWGNRIQYSVFVCTVGDDQVSILHDEVNRLIDPDQDSIYIIRQCKMCWTGLTSLGQGEPPRPETYWGVF